MKQTVILDSTKLSTFLECQQKLRLGYIENLTLSNAIDDAIAVGSYGHKLLEIYYKKKDIFGPVSAINQALEFHLDNDFPLDKRIQQIVKDRFDYYCMRYANENYQTISRSKDVIRVNNGMPFTCKTQEPLVEQGFSFKLLDTPEYLFVLEGRIDWMVDISGVIAWVDHKFQLRKRNLYAKSIQFRNYSLATGLNLGVINYIRLHQQVEETTLERQIVQFSPLDQRMWREELIEYYIFIAKIMRSGEFKKNRDSCSGKFGYKCQFTQICEEYEPELITNIKNTKYVKKEEWKPW